MTPHVSSSLTPQASLPPENSHGVRPKHWWLEKWLWGLLLVTLFVHAIRIADQPIRGEESRWAQGGIEMLQSGNWILPTQQHTLFPERPPLNSWTMALSSVVLGDMSKIAVRLPSVIATMFMTAWLYRYMRRWLPSLGATVVAGVFMSFGQVIQLGHLGESEAILTACIGVSLLGWHDAWLDRNEWSAWLIGFTAAGLAALTKGVQGPVYFLAVSFLTLWLSGWREPFRVVRSAPFWFGLCFLFLVVGAWAFPFWLQTDSQAVRDVWTGLIADRVTMSGLAIHLVSYPVEILACLLPWSLFLIPLFDRQVRHRLASYKTPLSFAITSVLITFPSVWLVTGARGRYYMPLTPILAVALGLIVWATWQGARNSSAQRAWWRFAIGLACVAVGLGTALALSAPLSLELLPSAGWMTPLLIGGVAIGLGCWSLGIARQSWQQRHRESLETQDRPWLGQSLMAAILTIGWLANALIVNQELEYGDFVNDQVASLKRELPANTSLVSYGPVHHRFMFCWEGAIELREWPDQVDRNEEATYFAIDYHPEDTAELRSSGRGRDWTTTSGTLPFQWELVAAVPMDRQYNDSHNWVLVGRIIKNEQGQAIAKSQPVPMWETLRR